MGAQRMGTRRERRRVEMAGVRMCVRGICGGDRAAVCLCEGQY